MPAHSAFRIPRSRRLALVGIVSLSALAAATAGVAAPAVGASAGRAAPGPVPAAPADLAAAADQPQGREAAPRQKLGAYDARSAGSAAVAQATARLFRSDAGRVQRLGAGLGPQGVVDIDGSTGTPRNLLRLDGTLSGPSDAPPAAVARGYVRAHLADLGLTRADLATLRLRASVRDVHGVTHLSWAQVVDGVPVFGNGLRAHVARDGSLVALQGAPVPGLRAGTASAPAARVTAAQARRTAARDVGARAAAASEGAAKGPAQATRWSNGDTASRVWFATATAVRPAWLTYSQPRDARAHQHVVDAVTGAILYRRSTVNDDRGDALVFDHYPGAKAGGTQRVVNLVRKGWLDKSASWLTGDSVWAWADVNDDDQPQRSEKTPVPGTKKRAQFALKTFDDASPLCAKAYPCTWDPDAQGSWRANLRQDATQGFYFASLVHDYLAKKPIGFTPQLGNFETDGGDPVLLHVLDGANTFDGLPDDAHVDNATMNTPPDGVPPVMQMFLHHQPFADSATDPYLPGSAANTLDNVMHEYVHGLSNRLVVDALGNSTLLDLHAGAMGEGWSDYYAMDYLATKGLLADTDKPGQLLFDRYLTKNRPLTRSEAIDCPVGVAAKRCVQFGGASGGYLFGDLGHATGGPEVHADSEIWSQTLWDLRAALGHRVTAALVTEGMSLSPANPTFLDGRDAILAADQALYGGDHNAALWSVFAARGMGWYASVADGADASALEDFSTPPPPTTPRVTVTGLVTDHVTGDPLPGVVVSLGGHTSAHTDVTNADGEYRLRFVPVGVYPEVVAHLVGYDTGSEPGDVSAPTTVVNFSLRRDWAAAAGGASLASFTGPDYGEGCGPADAIDQSPSEGWSTAVGAGAPTSKVVPKQITVRLPEPVDITGFGIDPSATCGDGGSASARDVAIEVSLDGAEFSEVASERFEPADRGRLNDVDLGDVVAGDSLPGVRYVRLWVRGAQVPAGTDCDGADAFSFSGCSYMDVTEFEVYGKRGKPVAHDAQVLSFNDFHGHLEASDPPLSTALDPTQTPAGGVEYLSAAVKALRAEQPDSTLTVAAGDLIGGSTFLSGMFQDQPSIEALEELGLDVSSVGNHEFDEGTDELLRMVEGGCPEDGCFQDAEGEDIPYDGADFDYLAANVIDVSEGDTLLPPVAVKRVDGIPIGFIGMTLEATPTLVNPAGVSGLAFLDEVETANRQAAALKARGVETIVVLVHEGGLQTGAYDQCVGISGAIVDIAEQVTPEVDLLVTGHTHQPYTCAIDDPSGNPRWVTSAASYGQVLTETHLQIDEATREVVRPASTSQNHLVARTVEPDPAETAIIEFWKALSEPIAAEVVGSLAVETDITGDSTTCRCEETPMADLVADAILFGTEGDADGGAQLALMNTGGVRASLRYDQVTNGEGPGEITYAETYNVAPFNNVLTTMDLTGAQLEAVLNQQYQPVAGRGSRPMLSLGVSDGFSYAWEWEGDVPAPNTQPGPGTTGGHVVPGSMTLNGEPIDPEQTYRVATLNFLADGGDLFTAFGAGANRLGGPEDLPNLAAFFSANPGLTPPADRVSGL